MKRIILPLIILLLFQNLSAQELPSMTPPVLKQRIVNVEFFSPLTGNLTFGYEQALVNSISLTGQVGIIGLSFVPLEKHQKGLFLTAGAKLYFAPDYWIDGMKRYNDFQGFYFNPEIVYSGFGFDYYDINGVKRRGSNNSFALLLNFGKQWTIANTVSIELYGGVGYGGSSVSADNYSYSNGYSSDLNEIVPYKFSHYQWSNQVPFAIDGGFNIGILLK